MWKNQENQKKLIRKFRAFLIFVVLGVFPSERAQKKLQNELLDVKKLDDTAENEPLQTSKIRKIWVYYAWCE